MNVLQKNVIFCLEIKKIGIPLQSLKKKDDMNITTLHNLSVLHIIRVVVVTSRGEKGCMC